MDVSANITTIMFTNEFKEDMKKIQATGLIEELRNGEIGHLMETQQRIRDYISTHYKKYIRKHYPDYYAMMICLVVNLDTIKGWEDFTHLFYPNLPYVGSGYYETQTDYKCCCSHCVSSENTTIVSYNGYYLAVGNDCILKSSIVSNFKEFKKLKKQHLVDIQLRRDKLMLQIKHYKSVKEHNESIQRSLQLAKENQEAQRKIREYNDSHRVCSCGNPCGKFLKCFVCKKETEDKCYCGKWKQKKFKKCFECNSQCS